MLGVIKAGLTAAGALFKWFLGIREAKERAEHRRAGRNEQKVADLADDRKKAATARRKREGVDRLNESELDDGLRKYARKPRK